MGINGGSDYTMRDIFASFASALRQRWLRGTVIVVLGAVIAAVSAFSIIIYSYYYSTVRTGLEAKARTATDFFATYLARSYVEYYNSAYRYTETFREGDRIELQFINSDGSIMMSSFTITSGTTPNTPDVATAIGSRQISTWVGRRTSTGERIMAASAPMIYSDGRVIGVMRYVTSLRLVDKQVFMIVAAAIGVGLVVLLLVFSVNLIFVRSFIKPVSEITKMSKRIAEGSYGIQINNSYQDEMGEMVESINEMSLKIAQTEKIQTEFISSISHELRTPLTAITGWGETLTYDESLDLESKRGISIILKEARRLTEMVEELLEFTRIEDGRFTLNIEMIDIAAELEDAIFTFSEILHRDELEFDYDSHMDDAPLIPGDPNRLKQVFLNLFDNAVKYGREGKRIEVTIEMAGSDFVKITIRDFGPGAPEDEMEIIKMKFYKGSNSKERGSGIGLAVCDEIVKFHGGTMELANADGGGFLVTLYLPVSSEAGSLPLILT
ncbi:MAG: HAMP domain-containing histidine kinase [Oscillospiraceae bacterium]|nr:HAMP domain-containing histidine kinase [Oscillospiraceae bacterium]